MEDPDCKQAFNTHLLATRQSTDVGVHGELGVQPKVAAELLYGCHGEWPGLLAHLQCSSGRQEVSQPTELLHMAATLAALHTSLK